MSPQQRLTTLRLPDERRGESQPARSEVPLLVLSVADGLRRGHSRAAGRAPPRERKKRKGFVAISRAPLAKIERLRKRMGWSFRWVSSLENDFNHDLHVAFTPKELQSGTATVRHHDRYQD